MTDRRTRDRRQIPTQSSSERRHGDRRTYQAGCTSGPDGTPCTPCRAANAAYEAAYRAKKRLGLPILGAVVNAMETWRQLRVLKPEYGHKGGRGAVRALAARLGFTNGHLQIGRQRATLRNVAKVQQLYHQDILTGLDGSEAAPDL